MADNSKLVGIFNECWENCSTETKIEIHNIYARENNPDNEIYENNEDFFETFFESRPFEAVRSAFFGNYAYADIYVWFNGYANLDSSDFIDDMPIYVSDMVDWFIENYDEISHICEMEEFCNVCENGFDNVDDEEEDGE